ncbi:ASTRA complex subunit [Arachnomyces sp. PD_36]|nr:ASTRA complex subunit [Arachnomyces sp. PD_36]
MSSAGPLSPDSPSAAVDGASQRQARPPATPSYIFRGHSSPIHALRFCRENLRLISGDADGWIVIWDVVSKRPVAVWKAHEGAILAVKGSNLGEDGGDESAIFTHGRDHKLRVWRIRPEDEERLAKTLPVEASKRPSTVKCEEPWLLHSLSVNALNFCAFSMCVGKQIDGQRGLRGDFLQTTQNPVGQVKRKESIEDSKPGLDPAAPPGTSSYTFLAVPNAMDSGAIDIFYLPAEKRVCTLKSDTSLNTGMLMAVGVFFALNGDLYLVSGYEDGHVMVHLRRGPILVQDLDYGPGANPAWNWERIYAYRAHSQPVLSLDIPSISPRTHFYSSSADAAITKHPIPDAPRSLLGGALKAESSSPLKSINTKHAGQQDLRIRSDGKIFATAGWDSKVRVYSSKTMKELAVLKWHKDGCYAVGFARLDLDTSQSQPVTKSATDPEDPGAASKEIIITEGIGSLAAVQQQRSRKAQNTHWLAAGSKDGKISLWDIY